MSPVEIQNAPLPPGCFGIFVLGSRTIPGGCQGCFAALIPQSARYFPIAAAPPAQFFVRTGGQALVTLSCSRSTTSSYGFSSFVQCSSFISFDISLQPCLGHPAFAGDGGNGDVQDLGDFRAA